MCHHCMEHSKANHDTASPSWLTHWVSLQMQLVAIHITNNKLLVQHLILPKFHMRLQMIHAGYSSINLFNTSLELPRKTEGELT